VKSEFADRAMLGGGGAGFVGSALVRRLLAAGVGHIVIVDNLLSADLSSVPEHAAVDFRLGSIGDDRILAALPRNLDYVFHLACYHGNQSSNGGIASRDFIFVEDIVSGLAACAERGEPGEAYNLASGIETSVRDLAALVNALTDNPTPPALAPPRDWDHSGRRFGNPAKAREQLGFTATTALRDGLGETITWTSTNRQTIRGCMLQHAHFVPGLRTMLE
jgi:nucleoside-diphosphate-sugar epimerase